MIPATAVVRADGSGTLAIEGLAPWSTATETLDAARRQVLDQAVAYARNNGQPLRLTATDPQATWVLQISAAGEVSTEQPYAPPTPVSPPSAPQNAHPQPTPATAPAAVAPAAAPLPQRALEQETQPPATERSFLSPQVDRQPALTGWRGLLGRIGIRLQPSAAEVAERADINSVSRHWDGPRTIVVLNGKGGAGKTPTTVLLSALLARHGSGSVCAVDGNVTRGTLGWRTEKGSHDRTILDMLPQLDALRSPSARQGDIAAFTHHQTRDQFDVLRSNPLLLSHEQKMAPEQLDQVHETLQRYYRVVVYDTGNDEGDALWLSIVRQADQIVLATTTRAEHAEAARLLLRDLRNKEPRLAALAASAAVIVSQADRDEAAAAAVADGFREIARGVATIPYDPAMRAEWLHLDSLDKKTQRAWLRAAAVVAEGL